MNDFDSGKSYNGCAQDDWDVMEIIVRDSSSDSGVALKNVMLSFDMIAYPLGDFGLVVKVATPARLSRLVCKQC